MDKRSASVHDAKASLLTPPDQGFAIYMVLNLCIWIGLWFAVTKHHGLDNLSPHHMAFLVSVGPLILAQVICNLSYKSSTHCTNHGITQMINYGAQVMDNLTDKSKRSMIYPFHKEGWKTMSGHLIISWMVSNHFDFFIHNRTAIRNHGHVSSDESSLIGHQ